MKEPQPQDDVAIFAAPRVTWHIVHEGAAVYAWFNRGWREGVISRVRGLRRTGCWVLLERAGKPYVAKVGYEMLRWRKAAK